MHQNVSAFSAFELATKHIGEHDKSKRDWNWRSLKTTWWEEIKIPGEQNPEKKQENSEKTKSGLVLLPTFD